MNPDSRHRLGLLAVATISLFGALFARLWFLQIVEGESFEAQAATNNREVVITPAPRGRILDRNGVALVDNRESIVVGIAKQDFGDLSKGKQDALVERLSQALSFAKPVDQLVAARTRSAASLKGPCAVRSSRIALARAGPMPLIPRSASSLAVLTSTDANA